MSQRLVQVNANLQRELSLILTELFDPKGALLTLTHVLVTPDLRQATVWISILNAHQPQELIKELNERSSEFYEALSKRVKMKYTPALTFCLDEQSEDQGRLEELFDKLHEEQQ